MSGPREVRSNYVKVVQVDKNLFRVDLEGEELRTPGRIIVESDNDSFLTHMIGELEEYPWLQVVEGIIEEPRPLCAYLIFSTQLDFPGPLFENCDLKRHLAGDPILNPSAGPEWTDQMRAWEPIASYLESFSIHLRPWGLYSKKERKSLGEVVRKELDNLEPPEVAVFHNLYHLYGRSIIGPLAFLRAPLSIVEFANAAVASSPLHYTFSMPVDEDLPPEEAHGRGVQEAKSHARICKDYLSYLKPIKVPTAEDIWRAANRLIQEGDISLDYYPAACPPVVPNFIAKLVEDYEPNTVLDPWLGLGTLAAPLWDALNAQRFLGVCSEAEILELSEQLFSDTRNAEFRLGYGDQGEYEDDLFDLVVSCLPVNGPSRDFEWNGKHQTVPLEVELAVRAGARLSSAGIAAYLVPSEYLFAQYWEYGRAMLREEGLNERAIFHLPSALLSPFCIFSMYVVVLERGASADELFVGEVTGDKAENKQLLDNFKRGKGTRIPERGQYVERKDFRGLPQLISKRKLEQQTKRVRLPRYTLSQIASLEHSSAERQGDNSLFVRLGGIPKATTDPKEIPEKETKIWAAVHCNKNKADARVVAEFLNGPLGRLGLASLGFRGITEGISISALTDLPIWLPPIEEQRKAIELNQRLQELEDTARSLRHDLWGRPDRLSEVEEKAENLNKKDALPAWLDTLPFPLASILWTYHTHKGDAQKRYSQLDYFFEGLTQFLAAILISGVKSDEKSFRRAWPEVLKALAKAKLSLERATVGTWVTVYSSLAKVVRSELKDEDAAAHWQRRFACEQKPLLEALTSKKMSKILQDANEFRNGWRGHGGIVGDDEAARRASLYYDLLLEFRGLVENRWRSYPLVVPESSKFKGGLNHYTVKRIVGSRTPFEKEKIALKQQMEDGVMHLASPSDGTACPLVPFIRLGASPADAKNACYFFSKREGEKIKYVSYHFTEKPEIETEAAETQEFLGVLLGADD